MKIEKCKYCNSDVKIKSKNSMNGHLTNCSCFKKWKDEFFNYDFLYEEYIVNGKSALQIANENGWPSSTIINKQLRKLGIEVRNIKDSHKMEKYKERIEKTNLQKWGAINPLCSGTDAYNKKNKTVREKYGVDNIFQHKDIKEKIRNTNLKKYGATSACSKNSLAYPNYFKSVMEKYGVDNPAKNPEIRKIQRLRTISNIQEQKLNGGQLSPSYNINSIPILEAKAKELGITDLQHAENGGEFYIKELGYWVDGYSKEKNIVIEVDENHHFVNGKLSERDVHRQKEIEKFLGCEFIRIRYENKKYKKDK